MYVVVSQTLFMQLRRVVGPFITEAEAEQWIQWHWNEYEVCSVLKVEATNEAPKPASFRTAHEAIQAADSTEAE